MLIETIKLNQFRNYNDRVIYFKKGTNIIVGNNGVGKTNVLEAIILISNTKSFRTSDESLMIKHNYSYGAVELKTDQNKLKVVINEKGKSFYIDNELKKRTSEMIGQLNAIIFKPGDIELFTQSPKARRKEVDIEIGKISKEYLNALSSYNRLIKQKNNLLKEKPIDDNLYEVVNDSLIPVIKTLVNEREKFINNINLYINDIYKQISDKNDEIKIIYKKCCDSEDIFINLQLAKEKDMLFEHSTFGPHKDDYEFKINNKNIQDFASQGQKRMIIIAFKLSIAKYIQEKLNKEVIILLDDVLSELDKTKSEKLLNMLPANQIIITTTDINNIKIERDYRLIELKEDQNG